MDSFRSGLLVHKFRPATVFIKVERILFLWNNRARRRLTRVNRVNFDKTFVNFRIKVYPCTLFASWIFIERGVFSVSPRTFSFFLLVFLFLSPIKLLFPRTRNDVNAWLLISNNSKYDISRFYWTTNILCFWFHGIFYTGLFSFLLKVAKNSLELEKWTKNTLCT